MAMVMDFELAKVASYLESAEQAKADQERKYLESQIEIREQVLEDIQIKYARGKFNEMDKLGPDERKAMKLKQKQEMQEAAQRLAEVEEQLKNIGGESLKGRIHRKAAGRLLKLCHDNGGVYIKVGQHLANLDYLIPQEYIEVLSALFDDTPRSKYEDVRRVIEEDLGGKIDEIFDQFNSTPIASASLAQVHVAYDKETGRKLAVKVQHAGLRETSVGDIFAVTSVVRAIDFLFEDFTFGWIADEIAPQLPKELDFMREGKNAERAAEDIKKSGLPCIIPKIIWNKTSSRVLTMEFEEGFKATDLRAIEKAGLNKQ